MLEPAELCLVLAGDDEARVEQSLARALTGLEAQAALVRNFSFEEAQWLARQIRLGRAVQAGRGDGGIQWLGEEAPPVPRKPRASRPSDEALRTLARELEQADAPLVASAHLWGARGLAPSYARQLEYSDRGAVYTISVPAARLGEVLQRLELVEGQATVLATWPPQPSGSDAGWLRDYPQVRRAAEALKAQDDAIVFLPVILRPDGG
jgi:hypothetical protein